MYAINTVLRVIRFISSSLIGLIIGFIFGYVVAKTGDISSIQKIIGL